jgi:hypothetical protein
MPRRPQPWYASLNQPPRNPNGSNRKPAPTNHSDPADRADPSTGRPNAGDNNPIAVDYTLAWAPNPGPIFPLPPASPSLDVVALQLIMQKVGLLASIIYADDPSPPDLPHAGIRSGEITGYRGWMVESVNSGPPMLTSLAHDFIWQPGTTIEGDINKAVNQNPIHPIFGGVYAFREFSGLESEIFDAQICVWPNPVLLSNIAVLGFAYGTVKLWGEVVEHDLGYRASFAKLTSIDDFIGVDDFDLADLRSRYHV